MSLNFVVIPSKSKVTVGTAAIDLGFLNVVIAPVVTRAQQPHLINQDEDRRAKVVIRQSGLWYWLVDHGIPRTEIKGQYSEVLVDLSR